MKHITCRPSASEHTHLQAHNQKYMHPSQRLQRNSQKIKIKKFIPACLTTHGPNLAEAIRSSGEQRSARYKQSWFLGVQWVDKCPHFRHPPSVSSSAPQDITPFIILLHATQLCLATFFGYNQAFMLILWWLSQTLDQTAAPQLTLGGRSFEEADNLSCELPNVTQWQHTKWILDVAQFHSLLHEAKLRHRNICNNTVLIPSLGFFNLVTKHRWEN